MLVYRCQCPCKKLQKQSRKILEKTCLEKKLREISKLKELTLLLNCRRLLKAVSCHHRSFPFVPPSAISTFIPPSAISRKRNPNFFASVRVRNRSRCFVKKIGCVVLRIRSTHGQTFISDPLLHGQASYLNVFESAWCSALQNVSCQSDSISRRTENLQ